MEKTMNFFPGNNHYYGSINRIGRTLAETKDPDAIEAAMEQMITDKQLDLYHRVLTYSCTSTIMPTWRTRPGAARIPAS